MEFKEITELVGKAKNGDQSAIAQLYEATSKAVYFTALKIVGNPSDAEDIAQDTYVTAISKLSELKDDATFPKWIKTIAANTAKNYMTKKKPMLFNTDEDEQAALGSIPEVSDEFIPDAAADKKETCRLVSEMIDNLPEKQRAALVMFYYDEMTISEIAEAMGTNDNTIKSRLNYARKYIKDEVEALAKKGTKLYGVAGIPLIAFVLRNLAADTAVPGGIAAKVTAVAATTVAATTTATVATTTTTTAATTVTTTATGFALGTAAKVAIAAVASVAVIGGGVAVANIISEPNVFEAEAGTPSEFELMLEDYLFGDGELDTKYFDDVEELEIYGEYVAVNRDINERCGYEEKSVAYYDFGPDNLYWCFETADNYEYEVHYPFGDLSDIEFISDMANLKYLEICCNAVDNIEPIKELEKLEELILIKNRISDINAFSSLKKLKILSLVSNDISDISSLKELIKLQYLYLGDNNISKKDVLSLKEALPNCEIHSDFDYEDVLAETESIITTTPKAPIETEETIVTEISVSYAPEEIEQMIYDYIYNGGELNEAMLAQVVRLDIYGKSIIDVYCDEDYNEYPEYENMEDKKVKAPDGTIVNYGTLETMNFVKKMPNLKSLTISFNEIRNIEPIAELKNLRYIDFRYNSIGNISALSSLSELEYLNLSYNGIKDFHPLKKLANLTELYLTSNVGGWSRVKINGEDYIGVLDTTWVTGLTNLKILYLNENGRLYSLEPLLQLDNLEELNLNNVGCSDLTLLAELKNIKKLWLYKNKITDITPLAELTNLEYLNLHTNEIQDLKPLEKLVNLKTLSVGNNKVTDISCLAGLTELEFLRLDENGISDISAVGNLKNLQCLNLKRTTITSIVGLENLSNLRELYISSEFLPKKGLDISPLAAISGLEKLQITSIMLYNIDALASHKNLNWLDLSINRIEDISALENLTKLTYLDLSSNSVHNIYPLSNLLELTYLNLSSNGVLSGNPIYLTDISPLSNLTKLETLDLHINRIVDLSPLANLINLKNLDLSQNRIHDLTPLSGLINLEELNLFWQGGALSSSSNLEDISPLSCLVNLKRLHVNANVISDVTPMYNLSRLEYLSVYDNNISDEDISELKNRFPDCIISA